MTTTRRQQLDLLRELHRSDADADARARAIELGQETDDPLLCAMAKSEELQRSRALGQQQRAIVAGAELVAMLEAIRGRREGDAEWPYEHVAKGLIGACWSSFDVPEVPLAAIDALIEAYSAYMRRIGWSDLYARRLEIRRSYIAGDDARAAAQIEALSPMINFTYGHRHQLGCPRCVLAELAEYVRAVGIDRLGELLRPVLEGTDDFPNENPAAVLGPDRLTCDAGRTAHVFYGRALLLAGVTDALDPHIHVARESDLDECFLLPMIFLLEAAMVTGDAARIGERVKLLRPRVERHEDVDEAMV